MSAVLGHRSLCTLPGAVVTIDPNNLERAVREYARTQGDDTVFPDDWDVVRRVIAAYLEIDLDTFKVGGSE